MEFRLRALREERGLNQVELAYHAGVSVSQISLLESGKRNPSATSLKSIADALGVGIADLFEPESPKGKAPRPSAEKSPEQRRAYPYQWMSDTLARTLDRWQVVVDAGRDDPKEGYVIANACLD